MTKNVMIIRAKTYLLQNIQFLIDLGLLDQQHTKLVLASMKTLFKEFLRKFFRLRT